MRFSFAPAAETGDFSSARLAQQVARLRAGKTGVFDLDIGAANSFASAPYPLVDDIEHGLHALRRSLTAACADEMRVYRPHVTLGLFRRGLARSVLIPLLERVGEACVRVSVTQLSWMVYEATDVGGLLMTVATPDLSSGEWLVGAPDLPSNLIQFARSGGEGG